MIVIFALAMFAFETDILAGRNSLRVWFFDVGQGDATLIMTPEGKRVLIDGGRDNAVLAKLGSVLPPWDRRIDAIILTHPDGDHAIGLVSVIERYDVGKIYVDHCDDFDFDRRMIEEVADRRGVPLEAIAVGREIAEFGLDHEVLWPEECDKDPNANSIVVLLRYQDSEILLTGDAEADQEAAFAHAAGDVDVLKVGHHGSITSSTNGFLDVTSPEFAVISMGEDNSYGHPHPVVLNRFEDRGVNVLRTDLDGDILLDISDEGLQIKPRPLPF